MKRTESNGSTTEALLHYVWKHRLLPAEPLTTTDGQPVEIVDPGLHNQHAGPDFFNAKLKIGETMWVGNVEIHDRASDWYVHGHETDAAYDNVVLHVVATADRSVETHSARTVPQVEIPVPERVRDNYRQLLATDRYPPCYAVIHTLSPLTVHSWMSTLQVERLEEKTEAILRRVDQCGGSWEEACFATIARSYGFGVNGDAFETWSRSLTLRNAAHHRDDLFQIEAYFMGQAGFLLPEGIPPRQREAAARDDYYQQLSAEYRFLANKFSLKPIDSRQWHFLRMRPQNFPYTRISQLATLYHSRRADLSRLMECTSAAQLAAALATTATPYWRTHYTFGSESTHSEKRLSPASLRIVIVNAVIPMLFAYGRHRRDESLASRAFQLLEELPPENNHITRMWGECGLKAATAGDSQSLLQLKNEYCDRKDCLRCRIGYEYLSRGKKGSER